MKNVTIIVILFFVALVYLPAQTITIDYVEGKVEVQENSKWTKVSSGDSIQSNASVRLANGSLLEFEYNGSKISLVEEGTYDIKSVVSSSKEVKSWGLINVVGSKIAKTFGKDEQARGNSALGARGDDKSEKGVDWAYEDNDTEQLPLAKSYIDDKRYKEAIILLTGYSKSARPEETSTVGYYLGYAHAMMGETALALQQVNKCGITSQDALYPDYVLLRGKLLLESLSYKKALSLFNEYLGIFPQGSTTQTVLILGSYCYKGMGDKVKQKESLSNAVKLDPASQEGILANKLLEASNK